MDQLDLSKFHLAVTLNHYANSAEGMVLIARATQKSNKLLQKGRAGQCWFKLKVAENHLFGNTGGAGWKSLSCTRNKISIKANKETPSLT